MRAFWRRFLVLLLTESATKSSASEELKYLCFGLSKEFEPLPGLGAKPPVGSCRERDRPGDMDLDLTESSDSAPSLFFRPDLWFGFWSLIMAFGAEVTLKRSLKMVTDYATDTRISFRVYVLDKITGICRKDLAKIFHFRKSHEVKTFLENKNRKYGPAFISVTSFPPARLFFSPSI